LQARKANATATVGNNLIDDTTAKSFESNRIPVGRLAGSSQAHFTTHFNSQGVVGVSITLALSADRRNHKEKYR
jgi:hypothetical protein